MRRSNECSHSRGVTLSDLQTSAAQRKQPLSTGWTSPTPQSRALGDLVWQYLVRRGTSSPSFEYHSTGTPIDYAATTVPPLYDHHEVVALPALPEPIRGLPSREFESLKTGKAWLRKSVTNSSRPRLLPSREMVLSSLSISELVASMTMTCRLSSGCALVSHDRIHTRWRWPQEPAQHRTAQEAASMDARRSRRLARTCSDAAAPHGRL